MLAFFEYANETTPCLEKMCHHAFARNFAKYLTNFKILLLSH